MSRYPIIPITEKYIESFREAVGNVAREHKYLAFLDTPALELSRAFVLENLQDNWPHFVALDNHDVIGWCDITSLHRPIFAHSGQLGLGVIAKYRGQGIGENLILIAIK